MPQQMPTYEEFMSWGEARQDATLAMLNYEQIRRFNEWLWSARGGLTYPQHMRNHVMEKVNRIQQAFEAQQPQGRVKLDEYRARTEPYRPTK